MARKITVELTAAQLSALVGAACTQQLELEDRLTADAGDPTAARELAVLNRASDALVAASHAQRRGRR